MSDTRPAFLRALAESYNLRRKGIVLLTGDVHGLFRSEKLADFQGLERTLAAELGAKFNVVRMDIATGISFYDEITEHEVIRICESTDGVTVPEARRTLMRELIERSKHSPLAALALLRGMSEAFTRARASGETIKPLCVVIQYAGSLLPAGDIGRMSEIDRQRLVMFLAWVTHPDMLEGPDLLIAIHPVKSEVNASLAGLPVTDHIEIQLPGQDERRAFVERFCAANDGPRFEGGRERFLKDSAGLTLADLEDLLEVAQREKRMVVRSDVVRQINRLLDSQLGDIIRLVDPQHGPEDIVGYRETGEIFEEIFERCDDPETAVSAILVSGPNGGGKTFQLEAYAAASGRVVVELAGLRGSYFGETDRFFELLRWHIATFGKILILVDEAHTAFGSVHAGDTHKTEKRLAGNIIKMMGNPAFLGKVVWGLMTSRPDELDPDIKSRAPIQVPIFDLEGDERRTFVKKMFARKRIDLDDADLDAVMSETGYYSARDYRNLVAELLAGRRKKRDVTVPEILERWQASHAIERERELQTLIAAQHCSYPKLIPERIRELGQALLARRIEELRVLLHA